MCNGMCAKSLQLQRDLFKKNQELSQMENELERIWSSPFIYNEDRLLELDEKITKTKEEISQIQNQLSKCRCYQTQCRLKEIEKMIAEQRKLPENLKGGTANIGSRA